jgi:hypothetical protein
VKTDSEYLGDIESEALFQNIQFLLSPAKGHPLAA